MSTSPDETPPPDTARRARRRANQLLGLMLGLALGGIGAIVVLVLLANWNRPPQLDRARLESQRAIWEKNRVADYDIEVHVTGPREATYRVSVRDNVAVSASIDGRPLGDPRTFSTWSVPGMFGTIERDIEAVERNKRAGEEASGPRLTLYATFDPRYGFPSSYQRFEWGEQSTNSEVTWKVEVFRPLGDEGQP
jgi:hypothetical protein